MDKAIMVMEIIRLLCPALKDMAERTNTNIDNIIVNIICSLTEDVSNN